MKMRAPLHFNGFLGCLLLCSIALVACHTSKSLAERETEAKNLFNDTATSFHLPSATANGPARAQLLEKAARGYEKVLSDYGDLRHWSAAALRSLANIRAEQGRLDDAIRLYEKVARQHPSEEWEILQSWKTAADLLWDAGQPARARGFYQRIIAKFDHPDAIPIVKIIVNQSKKRTAAPRKS